MGPTGRLGSSKSLSTSGSAEERGGSVIRGRRERYFALDALAVGYRATTASREPTVRTAAAAARLTIASAHHSPKATTGEVTVIDAAEEELLELLLDDAEPTLLLAEALQHPNGLGWQG
jgi:hypothetical protein